MKVLITGVTGFIGSYLFHYLSCNKYETIDINLRNLKWIFDINANAIVHLAGKAHDLKLTSLPGEYYQVNTELTQKVYNAFLASDTKVFITLSSVKAVADVLDGELTESYQPNPRTHYGKSKLLAEQYIFSKEIPASKRVYILRPCMIHGPGNKGNLNLLFKIISKNILWPLGAFENKRSSCSIDNLVFIIKELIEREDIQSGIYNVADDAPLSTNELIDLIAQSQNIKPKVWKISKWLIHVVALLGDKLNLPLNSERLLKLTSSYIVSNAKIKIALGKPLPVSSREGLLKTFKSFNSN